MSPRDDSSHLEAELRRVMARPPAPPRLGLQVMARIRSEARRQPEGPQHVPVSGRLWFRMAWALGAGACIAMLVATFAFPREEQEEFQARAAEMAQVERELVEVLQLAGSQWNRAQASAFPQGQNNEDD